MGPGGAAGIKNGFTERYFSKKRVLVDHQVALYRHGPQRFEHDDIAFACNVLYNRLACEALNAVDTHGVRPADPVGAAFPDRKGRVDMLLDIQDGVEEPVRGSDVHRIFLKVGCAVRFRIKPLYAQDNFHDTPASVRPRLGRKP